MAKLWSSSCHMRKLRQKAARVQAYFRGTLVRLVLDKDGTLVDFSKTWLPGYRECARAVAQAAGELALEPALLKAGGWVEEEGAPPSIAHDGVLLHAPLEEIAQMWIDTH